MSKTRSFITATMIVFTQLPVLATAQPVKALVRAEPAGDVALGLRFSVRSIADQPIRLYTAYLPWENVSSVMLIGVTESGRPLLREGPIDDPSMAVTQLGPGETVTGVIDLAGALPSFEEAVKSEEIVIFWSYQLSTISGERDTRTGGGCSFSARNGALLERWFSGALTIQQ